MLNARIPVLLVVLASILCAPSALAKYIYTDDALIDGFNRTVFGSEYSGLLSQSYVRKFPGPVRFYVRSQVGDEARTKVHKFISSLRHLIHRLPVQLVLKENEANFIVHIVNRDAYANTVRNNVYRRADAPVIGRCMVRSIYSRRGITRSDAVIVADEGEDLFQRCMIEEVLQGLGPLNDHPILSNSMFNDTSNFTKMRLFDRYILNMLYDRKVKNGAERKTTDYILPRVLRRIRPRLEPDAE